MSAERTYYVYIMASWNRVLYIGVTNDLERRLYEHKNKLHSGFTRRYHVTRLVWYDTTNDIHEAIAFEKKLKGLTRAKKVAIIEARNPKWLDLSANWS